MRNKQQSPMFYSTSEICSMYGLSASGLRFFEKKGLISPEREHGNRYRVFTLLECSRLFFCRILRQYGFSTDESIQLVLHGTPSDYQKSLHARKQAIKTEIQYKQALLQSLEQTERIYASLATDPPIYIVQCPTMLRLTCRNIEYFQQWYSALPFSAASLCINQSSLLDSECKPSYSTGFIIESNRAADYGLYPNEDTTILPARRCLYTILSYTATLDNLDSILALVLDAIHARGFILDGDPFTRMLGSLDAGQRCLRYDEAWFPITLRT